MCIKLIIGLGNPKKKYYKTRHNIGIWVINKLLNKKTKHGIIYSIIVNNNKIFFYTPNTYINKSGKNILKIKKKLGIKSKKILIIHDDININIGKAKIKKGIKLCTHNGIKNIYKYFKKKNIYRLRIGIGKPIHKEKLNNFVLSSPNEKEKKLINLSIKKSIYCIKLLFKNKNMIKVQNILNSYK